MTTLTKSEIGAITWYAMAYGTEAGPTPNRLTVAAQGGYQGAVIANSGYSLGIYQFDFSQRGGKEFPAGTNGLTYSQAFYDTLSSWATSEGRTLTLSRDAFASVMATHGGDQTFQSNREKAGWPLQWLPQSDWNLVRDWGTTQGGREWVNSNLDASILAERVSQASAYLTYGQVDGWSRAETIRYTAIMSKAVNQQGVGSAKEPTDFYRLKAYMAGTPDATYSNFMNYANGLGGKYIKTALHAGDIANLVNKIEANPGMTALWNEISDKVAQSGLSVREAALSRMFEDFFQNSYRAGKFVDAYGSESGGLVHWKQSNGDIIDGSGRDGWLLIKHPNGAMDYLVDGKVYAFDKNGNLVSDESGSLDRQTALGALTDSVSLKITYDLALAKDAITAANNLPAEVRDAIIKELSDISISAQSLLNAIDRGAADFVDQVSKTLNMITEEVDALSSGTPYDNNVLNATRGLSDWLTHTADDLSQKASDAWDRLQDELDKYDFPSMRAAADKALADLVDNGKALASDAYDKVAKALSAVGETLEKGLLEGGRELSQAFTDLVAQWTQAESTTSPLILDLDGDGVQTLAKSAGTHFDHNADGFAENTGWVGAHDGLLARDLDGNGKIDTGSELFGDHTRLKSGALAANGFEALKELDGNGDGVLDTNDAAWSTLKVWQDADSDGVTDAGELIALDAAGVKSIRLAYTDNGASFGPDAQNNVHRQSGRYTASDGSSRSIDDVWFDTTNWDTVNNKPVAVSDAIAALPDLAGTGTLGSLRQAMARDASGQLQALLGQYVGEADPAKRDVLLQDIL
jgi:hypothetical protein